MLANGNLYVGSSVGVYCLDPANGNVLWNFVTTAYAGADPTYPVYANGVIYVGCTSQPGSNYASKSGFFAINGLNGQILWNCTLNGSIAVQPIVEGNAIYVAANYATIIGPRSETAGSMVALLSNINYPLPTRTPTNSLTKEVQENSKTPQPTDSTISIVSLIAIAIFIATLLIFLKVKQDKDKKRQN